MLYFLVVAAFFFILFVVGFLRDRRRLINGIYLFLALAAAGLGLLLTVLHTSRIAAAIVIADSPRRQDYGSADFKRK